MTRKLVDVSQDVIVTIPDCGTVNGLTMHTIYSGDEESTSLASRIYGRTSLEKVTDPVSGKVILKPGQHIDEATAEAVENVGLEQLRVRSALTCEADRGCCVKCYGLNLATNELAQICLLYTSPSPRDRG